MSPKYYEEWEGISIEVTSAGELIVEPMWRDGEVSDEQYGWVVERLREKGVEYHD